MLKLGKRLAIGAMAVVMAASAFSAQAATANVPGAAFDSAVLTQDLADSIQYYSLGDLYDHNVTIPGSAVQVNAYSGNVFFMLDDMPLDIYYNSQRDINRGFGSNFTSNATPWIEPRDDGSYVYHNASGNISHFTGDPNSSTGLLNEGGWMMYPGASTYIYGNSNTRPEYIFHHDGKFYKYSWRDMNGRYHTNIEVNYDENGNLYSSYYNADSTYAYYPAAEGEQALIKSISTNGKLYQFFYNDQKNLERVEDGNGLVLLDMDYDATGKLVTRVGSTYIEYDEVGRAAFIRTYQSSGTIDQVLTFDYGEGATFVDNNGAASLYRFDVDGSRLY